MATDWVSRGHEVEVVTARTTGTDGRGGRTVGGVRVSRVPVVAEGGPLPAQPANLVVFPLGVALRLLRGERPDVITCSTAPQVTLGVAVSLVARWRRAAFVYHCMDLHPEIGRLSGEFARPWVYRLLLRLDTATMRRASRVVVLSEDMRRAVEARDPRLADRTSVLNNFSLGDDDGQPSPLPEPASGRLRVVFTGNFGRFQGLADLVASVGRLPSHVDAELVLMGEGRARTEVDRAVSALPTDRQDRVLVLPPGPPSAARALMRSAHVGVVSLAPEVARYAYPSKTATYAEQGLPLLVVCEGDTELGSSTVTEGLGWAVEPGDVEGLASAMAQAFDELASGRHEARCRRVREHYERTFAKDRLLERWSGLLGEVAAARRVEQERTA
ncbi:glycosyltransferase family 4 protein [Arthrobacter sp. NEB 688]|uniref:glycosyltransferase family 4 protein n=1 Tax=Arthrobacter sp. NEB 688 TaxID=904039 RepID=UPI001563F567|nr:glycosyltransferase family 4 protein [Arthrobacter sp. NEB 688]QKE85636.1 glycosyltransferase family 4 protein [Arthrobacter sp. NEB 688]